MHAPPLTIDDRPAHPWAAARVLATLAALAGLGCACLVGSCRPDPLAAATALHEEKLEAIRNGDLDAFMATVSGADPYYRNESEAWFWYTVNNPFEDLSLAVERAEYRDDGSIAAAIRQAHRYEGRSFDFSYTLRLTREGGRWVDADLDWETDRVDGFVVHYMPGERNLAAFERFLLSAAEGVTAAFGEGPAPGFPVKLYTDRELLRQRTYPILSRQFTAWGSPDESLKIYSGFPRVELYEGTVRHELVHHVTSRMSGYNIPGWYAEGLAVHYGNSVTLGGDYVSLGRISADDARLTIGELEAADQVRMTDDREVYAYYGASGLIVRYIEEAYGPDSHLRLLKRLGELPWFDRARHPDPESVTQPLLRDAFVAELGVDADGLSRGYLDWLDATF